MSKKKNRKKAAEQAALPTATKENKPPSTRGLNSMTNWLIGLLIILPVLISSATMDPVLSIRYTFLSGFLLALILFFFLYRKTAAGISYPPFTIAVFGLGSASVAWMLVCTSSAINYQDSYYETARSLLNLIFLFVVMITVMKEELQLMKIFKTLVIVSLVQSFAGITQYYEIAFNDTPGANEKPYGLMGNRNLFGSAQALLLPFVIYTLHRANRFWKVLSGFALAGLLFSLLLSQTRSAWLASIAILLLSFVLVIIFSKTNRRKWMMGAGAVAGGTALIVFLALSSDTEGELKRSVRQRTNSLTQGGTTTDISGENIQERLRIWNKTVAMIRDEPMTGTGPGNWRIAIPQYGSEGLVWASGRYIPDRVHNVYLQVAAETGLPGAFFYFGMWLLIAIIAIKIIIKPVNEEQRILVILVLAGLAGLATDAMFSFPTERIEHSVYIFLMGGIILGIYGNHSVAGKKFSLPKLLIIGLAAVCLLNLLLGFSRLNFEKHMSRTRGFENAGRYTEMLEEAQKGKSGFISLDPTTSSSMELKSAIALKELKQYDRALQEADQARQYHPYGSKVWNTLGTIYTDMGQYEKAVECYEFARQLTPQYDVILKNLAINYFQLKKYKECAEALGQVDISKDPDLQSLMAEAKRLAGQ